MRGLNTRWPSWLPESRTNSFRTYKLQGVVLDSPLTRAPRTIKVLLKRSHHLWNNEPTCLLCKKSLKKIVSIAGQLFDLLFVMMKQKLISCRWEDQMEVIVLGLLISMKLERICTKSIQQKRWCCRTSSLKAPSLSSFTSKMMNSPGDWIFTTSNRSYRWLTSTALRTHSLRISTCWRIHSSNCRILSSWQVTNADRWTSKSCKIGGIASTWTCSVHRSRFSKSRSFMKFAN